jgi:ABC-type transport system involved in multi-copper enzyme maturation permease subunit
MNALVKKEIRLLLPSWIVAVLLALVQGITRPYDFYVASLLFFGLTLMALTTIGRETSLNTFSSLLAQPAERLRLWQVKLSVLAAAFLTVFVVWLAAFVVAFFNSNADPADVENSYNLFITICLIATATFTGGLWTTLLLRQIAGAFWLTLLVPAVLAGFTGAFLAQDYSDNAITAVLCVVLGIYSVGGFVFARWLFFRAQDVGWTGGIIALPEWKLFAAGSDAANSPRRRKPIFALLKKELQLQQVSLLGGAGLLVLHAGVIWLRTHHTFAKDSAGEGLTSIFWMLWLVLPVMIGAMAVAEERRLGVMEGQLCLPVSRRVQFVIKVFLALLLGTLLGGVLPMLLETGAHNLIFKSENNPGDFPYAMQLSIVALAAWLALVSFFASSLARNFLQAIGCAIGTFIGSALIGSALVNGRMFFLDYIPMRSVLPVAIAIPTAIVALPWLAYLNFKNFRDGWPLWRRNLLGAAGAFGFVIVASLALYNRAWEIFEPAEPPHGPAKLSLGNPPALLNPWGGGLCVRLPDGRVWFDYLYYGIYDDSSKVKWLWRVIADPLPKSGVKHFIAGSNWVSATARHVDYVTDDRGVNVVPGTRVTGYLDTVGVQTNGTLWVSDASGDGHWTGDKMSRFGSETNWRQVARSAAGVLLLKNDGTLWRWGTNHFDWNHGPIKWPSLRTCQPYQVGTDAGWKTLGGIWNNLAQKSDGSIWSIGLDDKNWKDELHRDTNLDQVPLQTLSLSGDSERACVRPDGTLWVNWDYVQNGTNFSSGFVRAGTETNWTTVALNQHKMVALKSDGSLWQWILPYPWESTRENLIRLIQKPPTRIGIHNDWVAIAGNWQDVIALAADGSLWLWPDREQYEGSTLLKLPKQPQWLGNVFSQAE